MKHLVLLAASALSLALAQNNTYAACLMSSPQYNSSSGVSTYYFCNDNKCYNANRSNATVKCTNIYNKTELVKRTTTFTQNADITITKLERDTVPITGMTQSSDGWYTLTKGQSVKVGFYNKGEKSAFIDVDYKSGTVKDANKKIGFYVYNKDTPDKVFDMSVAEKVLLPQSSANFQTVLVAEGGDFTFKLDFSGS
jgi:hypothetical protein